MSEVSSTIRDPICEMTFDPKTATATAERNGKQFYFCSTHCRDNFVEGDVRMSAKRTNIRVVRAAIIRLTRLYGT